MLAQNGTGREVLGLITARGGSKGIPRKNLAPLAGKPLLAWTVEAALASRAVGRLVLSTDDEEIARVGADLGAETPFLRPAHLAGDASPHDQVVLHAVQWLEENQGYAPDFVLLLQPTSPLRAARDIDDALEIALKTGADGVMGVTEAKHHPNKVWALDEDGRLEPFIPRPEGYLRRQSLRPAYAENGAVYLLRRSALLRERNLFLDRMAALVMPPERSLDVDTPWDLHLADLAFRHPYRAG